MMSVGEKRVMSLGNDGNLLYNTIAVQLHIFGKRDHFRDEVPSSGADGSDRDVWLLRPHR